MVSGISPLFSFGLCSYLPGNCNLLFLTDAGAEGLRCPSNCSDCYQGKLATDCYSYDKYGNFLGCRTFAGNATLMRALNDTTVAKGMSFASFVSATFIC